MAEKDKVDWNSADVIRIKDNRTPERKAQDRIRAAAPELMAAAAGGGEVEDIYLYELQRIAGPDATLSETAQTRLHTLRQQRYAAIAKAKGEAT